MAKNIKILCINGVGLESIYSAQILATLEHVFGTSTYKHFDLVSGAFTSGLTALSISAEIPMNEVVRFYMSLDSSSFTWMEKGASYRSGNGEKMYDRIRTLFQSDEKEKKKFHSALFNLFKEENIKSHKTKLYLPTYSLDKDEINYIQIGYGSSNYNHLRYTDLALSILSHPFRCNHSNYIPDILSSYLSTSVLNEALSQKEWMEKNSLEVGRNKIEIFSIGSSERDTMLFQGLKSHLDFDLDIVTIPNLYRSMGEYKVLNDKKTKNNPKKIAQELGAIVADETKYEPRIQRIYSCR